MHNCLELAEVMTIAAKYLKEDDFPTHCEHDVMWLCVEPSEVSDEDRAKREVAINPMLKPFGFQSIVDPFTAFQELSMYVSGVLGSTGVDMIQVSDEDMKYKKGFHDMSFKNRGKKCPQ